MVKQNPISPTAFLRRTPIQYTVQGQVPVGFDGVPIRPAIDITRLSAATFAVQPGKRGEGYQSTGSEPCSAWLPL